MPPSLSGYSSAPTILPPRIQVPSTPSMLLSFIVKFMLYLTCENNQNKQIEAGFGPFLKNNKYLEIKLLTKCLLWKVSFAFPQECPHDKAPDWKV